MGFDSHFPRPRTSSSASYYDIVQMMREVANLRAGHVATGVSGWMDGWILRPWTADIILLTSLSSEKLVENFLIHMTNFQLPGESMRTTYLLLQCGSTNIAMFRNLVATSCMGWAEMILQDNNNNSDRADLNRGFRDKNLQGLERSPWRGYGGDCSVFLFFPSRGSILLFAFMQTRDN